MSEDQKSASVVSIIYSQWGDGGMLRILPERIRFGVQERVYPPPPPVWLLDCHDVDKDEPRTLVLDKVVSFTGYPPRPEVESLQNRINTLQMSVARLEDVHRVLRRMANESTAENPIKASDVYNLVHADQTHGDVYVAELHELRLIIGELLDTQDKVNALSYSQKSVTHEEVATIYSRQYRLRKDPEGRAQLELLGRLTAAVMSRKPYAPVEGPDNSLNGILVDLLMAAGRLRRVAQAPPEPSTTSGFRKGWKAAMEAAVAAYKDGARTWLL